MVSSVTMYSCWWWLSSITLLQILDYSNNSLLWIIFIYKMMVSSYNPTAMQYSSRIFVPIFSSLSPLSKQFVRTYEYGDPTRHLVLEFPSLCFSLADRLPTFHLISLNLRMNRTQCESPFLSSVPSRIDSWELQKEPHRHFRPVTM